LFSVNVGLEGNSVECIPHHQPIWGAIISCASFRSCNSEFMEQMDCVAQV